MRRSRDTRRQDGPVPVSGLRDNNDSRLRLAAFAFGLDRQVLWQVVRACVADFNLTGAPFPCLAVNLFGGEERGYVVLRPPMKLVATIPCPDLKVAEVGDVKARAHTNPGRGSGRERLDGGRTVKLQTAKGRGMMTRIAIELTRQFVLEPH